MRFNLYVTYGLFVCQVRHLYVYLGGVCNYVLRGGIYALTFHRYWLVLESNTDLFGPAFVDHYCCIFR